MSSSTGNKYFDIKRFKIIDQKTIILIHWNDRIDWHCIFNAQPTKYFTAILVHTRGIKLETIGISVKQNVCTYIQGENVEISKCRLARYKLDKVPLCGFPFWILHPPPSFSSSSYNLYTVAVLFSTRCSCLYIVNQFQIYCAPNRLNVLKQFLRERSGPSMIVRFFPILFINQILQEISKNRCGRTGLVVYNNELHLMQERLGYILRIKNFEL